MNQPSTWPARGLYAITPEDSDTARLLARVEPVLRAGAALLQYRNKSAPPELRGEQALALRGLCRHYRVPLIVNDDVALAREIAADGVHLGAGDGDLAAARSVLGPEAILGASCYDDLQRARRACAAGASYLAFGACCPSSTKPDRPRAAPALFTAARALGLPLVAIGGLKPENAGVFLAAGADLIAAIAGLFDDPDPGAAAHRYLDLFRNLSA